MQSAEVQRTKYCLMQRKSCQFLITAIEREQCDRSVLRSALTT